MLRLTATGRTDRAGGAARAPRPTRCAAAAYDAVGGPDTGGRAGRGRRLRPRRAGAVQRPRRGARPRRRGADVGDWAGADLVPAVGLGRRPSTTRCGRSRRCWTRPRADLRVALGLLDARHLAGDPNLTLRLRTAILAHWRRDAREQAARAAGAGRGPRPPAGRARPRQRSPTSRSPPGGCATPPCSRPWSPPGSSTCRTPSSSAAGTPCSTSATRCTRWPAGPPTGSPRSCGRTWRPSLDAARRRPRPSGTRGPRAAGSPTSPG